MKQKPELGDLRAGIHASELMKTIHEADEEWTGASLSQGCPHTPWLSYLDVFRWGIKQAISGVATGSSHDGTMLCLYAAAAACVL